jgi:predicted nucleic acid-binding protein
MTMMGGNMLFIDTNVLIYATDTLSPLRQQARDTLHDAQRAGTELVVSSQVLREYLAAATRQSVTSNRPALADAMTNVRSFRTSFRVVYSSSRVLDHLVNLLQTISAAGRQIHDTNIVATMQAYSIAQLLTHNVSDFTRFANLITVVPLLPNP